MQLAGLGKAELLCSGSQINCVLIRTVSGTGRIQIQSEKEKLLFLSRSCLHPQTPSETHPV